jgi:hypothetical protein
LALGAIDVGVGVDVVYGGDINLNIIIHASGFGFPAGAGSWYIPN